MRALRIPPSLLCAWILCTLPVFALAPRTLAFGTFDPARDLDGFEVLFRSDLRDLYPVEKYADLLGTELSDAAIQKLREQWTEEKARGDAEAARLRADPALLQMHVLRRELRAHKYLAKIELEERTEFARCPLFIQKAAKSDESYVARTSATYSAWLKKLVELFDARYAKPLALKWSNEDPLLPVVILASTGDFRNYANHPSRDALYDSERNVVIGHGDAFGVETSPVDARVRLLYSFARALVAGYETDEMRIGSYWFEYGFPIYLSYHTGLTPAALEKPELQSSALDKIVQTCADRAKRETLLFPITEIVGIPDIAAAAVLSNAQAKRLSIAPPSEADLTECFRAQVVASMHFLQDGHGDAGRAAFLQYLKARLSGTPDGVAFLGAYDEAARAKLDADFYDYVLTEHAKAFPARAADPSLVEGLFVSRPATVAPAVGEGAAAASAAPAFEPKALALRPDDLDSQHALAIAEARAGDLDGARKRLAALASRDDRSIAREIERVDALIQLRDGFFQSLVAAGTKWVVELEGKKIVAPITKIEGGFLLLGANKQGITKIPLAAISMIEIAKQADKKEKQGSAPPWARSFAFLLAGEAKWDKLPKDDSAGAKALRADASTVYAALFGAADAAAAIERLSAAGVPQRASEAETALSSIESLVKKHRDVPFVLARLADLRELARLSLAVSFGEAGVAGLLKGANRTTSDGRVFVTYEFESPAEAEDFFPDTRVMSYMFKAKDKEAVKPLTTAVDDGDLVLWGAGVLRHRLRLSGAFRIALEFQFAHIESNDVVNPWFNVLVHCDGQDSAILSDPRGVLYVRDEKTRYDKQSIATETGLYLGTDYKLEIVGDGTRVTTHLDGEKMHEAAYGPRTAGLLGLLVRCETPLRIHRLDIEGTLDASAKDELISTWTLRKLAELGFE
jgi:hypothetical protein